MEFYDIFNGDADGLCSLHQLRLVEPRSTTLITGVKRDVALLARIAPASGDELTVLDISLDANREALLGALRAGARVRYFDHHFAGAIPDHPLLEAHIDLSAGACTSLIVDRHLGGRHRAWAVAAAFGDNLGDEAHAAAKALGLGRADIETLRELGECLNYNAYGATPADLHFHPAELYRRMRPHADPFAFCRSAPELDVLRRALDRDLDRAFALPVENVGSHAMAVFMPETAWSRRVAGTFANALSRRHRDRIVAVLVRNGAGHQVSLRAPERGGTAMHVLARQFRSGNGRTRAAGIQFLPEPDVAKLMELLRHPAPPA
jgi:hypothetical protein